MLRKITLDDANMIQFSRIQPNATGSGLVFVRGGRQKFTSSGKPFVTLFLQDVDDNVIPGYIFNVEDFIGAGLELKKVIQTVIHISYQENYLQGIGLTLILNKVETGGELNTPDNLKKFVGSVVDAENDIQYLESKLSELVGKKITVPAVHLKSTSLVDYDSGRVGGLASHYRAMLNILIAATDGMPKDRSYHVFASFVIFILANTIVATSGEAASRGDIIAELLSRVSTLSKPLQLGNGVYGLITHLTEPGSKDPDDIYMRVVINAHRMVMQSRKEFKLFETLAVKQTGNAGFGQIARYDHDAV